MARLGMLPVCTHWGSGLKRARYWLRLARAFVGGVGVEGLGGGLMLVDASGFGFIGNCSCCIDVCSKSAGLRL